MKTRVGLMLAVVGGIAAMANAQGPYPTVNGANVSYELSWVNTTTGTATALNPGDSARISLTISSNPAPGAAVSGTWTAGGGSGTLSGILSFFVNLVGTGGAEGGWNQTNAFSNLPVANFPITGLGTSAAGGATLENVSATQFPPFNSLVSGLHPLTNAWVGTWTPDDYSGRTVTFSVANGTANPQPFANALGIAHTGSGPLDPPVTASGGDIFGSVGIQIVPSPSSLALLGLGGLVAARRRR